MYKSTFLHSSSERIMRQLIFRCCNNLKTHWKQSVIMINQNRSFGSHQEEQVVVYTDGSCRNQKAGIGVYFPGNASLPPQELSESVEHCRITNQVAELTACIRALEVAKQQNIENLLVRTDSQYVVGSMTNWIHHWKENNWKKKGSNCDVKNIDLIKRLDDLCRSLRVEWVTH